MSLLKRTPPDELYFAFPESTTIAPREEQWVKALCSMKVTDFGMDTDVNEAQYENALLLIDSSDPGRATDFREAQP